MFSLVKFSNDQFGVLQSKHVQQIAAKIYIAKCSAGKYEALLVAKSDDKSKLLDLKNEKEKILSSNGNSPVDKLHCKYANSNSPTQEAFLTSNTCSPSTSGCRFSLEKLYNKKFSDTLRGTILRKHLTTYTSLLNEEEASVLRLADCMAHHKEIHKTIFKEITCLSQILMATVGDDYDVDGDSSNSSEDYSDDENSNAKGNSLQESLNSTSSTKKRRRRSPFGKTKRCRWSDAEKEAISCIFGDLSALKQLPTLNECKAAISQSKALNQRTPQQIKSWIDNQRRYKAGKVISSLQKNTYRGRNPV